MQHLDEGTIHTWLDGQLPADKADEIAAHADECPECAGMIAEARGLVAASTRILTALDNVPVGVMPVVPPSEGLSVPIRRRRWYDRTDIRVAAALLFVAGASLVVVRGGRGRESTSSRAMMTIADTAPATASATSPTVLDTTSLKPSGAETLNNNRSASGSVEHRSMPLAASPSLTPSPRKAMADALSPSAKPSVDETRQLNAPATSVRARESGMMKSAPMPPAVAQAAAAPVPPQVYADARRTSATGTAVAKKSIGSVEGRVIARDSGKGLTGASVNVLGTPVGATTDSAGRFKIENVPAGQQRVAVRRIGYAAQSIPLVIDSGSTANAEVALAPSSARLEEIVVSSSVAKVDVAAAPLHVQRTDSSASATRTVYQISRGIEVTLTESRVDTGVAGDFASKGVRANEAVAQRSADAAKERDAASTLGAAVAGVSGGRVNRAMAVADSASVPLNTISWRDRGRRYTLTGRLTKQELEILKARLMTMHR